MHSVAGNNREESEEEEDRGGEEEEGGRCRSRNKLVVCADKYTLQIGDIENSKC